MIGGKEIRTQTRSVQNTQKITRAMEMVAASKMRKAQERMRAARPYGEKLRAIAAHMSHAHPEYRHPFLLQRHALSSIGAIVVTSDKGLCGGLNTNVLRLVLMNFKEWEAQKKTVVACAIGTKGLGFLQRVSARVIAHTTGLGDTPSMNKLIGPVKVMLDAFSRDEIGALYLFYTKFVNTMKQEPAMEQLLPLGGEALGASTGYWDYIYEPDAKIVVDDLMARYIESLIYQAVAENMASEQSSRMVAMKAASDNAGTLIEELNLAYNKARQAGITKELSEIVAGAAAV